MKVTCRAVYSTVSDGYNVSQQDLGVPYSNSFAVVRSKLIVSQFISMRLVFFHEILAFAV